VRVVAEMLGAVGERARAGDWIITGSVVQVPIGTGEQVLADFGTLGQVAVRVSPQSQTHALR
jgi:2-keto-4-pentenoate hydratase